MGCRSAKPEVTGTSALRWQHVTSMGHRRQSGGRDPAPAGAGAGRELDYSGKVRAWRCGCAAGRLAGLPSLAARVRPYVMSFGVPTTCARAPRISRLARPDRRWLPESSSLPGGHDQRFRLRCWRSRWGTNRRQSGLVPGLARGQALAGGATDRRRSRRREPRSRTPRVPSGGGSSGPRAVCRRFSTAVAELLERIKPALRADSSSLPGPSISQ